MNNLSRRRFLKIAGAGAGAAAAGSSLTALPGLRAAEAPSEKGIRQVPTFCDICFWKCNAIATVRDGAKLTLRDVTGLEVTDVAQCERGAIGG